MTNPALIICDIDEVVLRYFCYLNRGLSRTTHSLKVDNFDLKIWSASAGAFVSQEESDQISDQILEKEVGLQMPIEGAVEHLTLFARHCNIVLLTNVRQSLYEQRQARLEKLGLTFPIVRNQGGKGKAVAQLIEDLKPTATFVIDDSVRQLQNIEEKAPCAYLIRAVVTPETKQARSVSAYPEFETWTALQEYVGRTLEDFTDARDDRKSE